MVTKKQAWGLGVTASILTIISLVIVVWPHVGWTTPEKHDMDIITIEAEHVVSEQRVLDAIKLSRDEWKCDEYDEELEKALERQIAGDSSVKLRRRIEKLRDKMDELICSRFDDFG